MPEATAFSPAGISSFFEIRDRRPDGRPFTNPAHAGARGGGVVVSRGVRTRVRLQRAERSHVHVRINGRPAPDARTTIRAVSDLFRMSSQPYSVAVDHYAEVPIGAGYGASAAGALSAVLAFSRAANLSVSMNQLGTAVHLAEIQNGTGLGTVGPLLSGGLVITTKSGGPGIAVIDRIPVSPKLRVVSACLGPIPTKGALRSKALRKRVNALGASTLRSIMSDPRPSTFMAESSAFAYGLGLMSRETAQLLELMNSEGAIGATQNMLGQAVHAIAQQDTASSILKAVKRRLPRAEAFSCRIDFTGPRIL